MEIEQIRKRMVDLDCWLRKSGSEVFDDQHHLDHGTIEQLYWHYGQYIALRDALEILEPSNG